LDLKFTGSADRGGRLDVDRVRGPGSALA